jgi:1-deoxy-D-xylulose-5-phosphate synthase
VKKNSKLLDRINNPQDIKSLNSSQLKQLAQEIRELIINTVSKNGGHLSTNLGAVEFTLALHYVFDSPNDLFIWDVGHQCYTHKILTGRKNQFSTLRQLRGLSGFPNPSESEHDHFIVGHGSTAISQALGLVTARDLLKNNRKVIAIVGDASLAGGMAFEALNYLGHVQKDLLIILNDNEWAISRTVGAMSKYLNRIIVNPLYNKVREEVENFIRRLPKGELALKLLKKFEESLKNLLVPGMLFEELGIKYVGPINGHDLNGLITTFQNVKKLSKPVLVHILTKKGKGYKFSEENPELFHSASPFDIQSGEFVKKSKKTYTDIFSEKIVDLGYVDSKVVAVTAAMPYGTGLSKFQNVFPERFFDVGMAEQNAVTFSSGLAKMGFKPYVAIYSTFIQRAYDQIMHDVCLQNLPVKFCLDRAGLVGADGPTHHGVFDIAFLKHLPNIVLLAPKDGWEFSLMLQWMKDLNFPSAIRYPKDMVSDLSEFGYKDLEVGKAELLLQGKEVGIIAYGSMVEKAYKVARMLQGEGIYPYLVNLRFAKPLDSELILEIASEVSLIITIEEGSILGGIGESISRLITEKGLKAKVFNLGIPDKFITHGTREELFSLVELDCDSISRKIKSFITQEVKC